LKRGEKRCHVPILPGEVRRTMFSRICRAMIDSNLNGFSCQ
jgi:hypothetical protein